jgi:hypothetical protein
LVPVSRLACSFVVDWDPPWLDPVAAMVFLGVPSVLLAAVTPIAQRRARPSWRCSGERPGVSSPSRPAAASSAVS